MAAADHLTRAIDRARNIRVTAALSTGLVAEAQARHQLAPVGTFAVGRALTSGLLLATLTKGDERVTVQISGDGPLGAITADANGQGEARGYAMHPEAGQALAAARIAEAVGRHGVVNVVRDLGLKELYQGQVALVTGEIDEDIEAYLRTSEQVPSALGCEVLFDGSGAVRAAGGLLVQALPGGDPALVREIQHALRAGGLSRALESGPADALELAARVYDGALEQVGERRSIRFRCRCSSERIAEMLALLGTVDLDEMIAEGKPAEVLCNFCNTRYFIPGDELDAIRTRAAGHPRENN